MSPNSLVLCAQVPRLQGEAVRRRLVAAGLLAPNYAPASDGKFVYFPLVPQVTAAQVKKLGAAKPSAKAILALVKKLGALKLVQKKLHVLEFKPRSLKEALVAKLTPAELSQLVNSFDIIGKIAILEIPDSLLKKQQAIARAVFAVHPALRTVCRKASEMKGEYRVRELAVIAGEKKTETEYKENGVPMLLDPAKVYFSPRLATERERIARQVKKGERILALFAGVGPFPLIVSKFQPRCEIVAIELNPAAVSYLCRNIQLNCAGNIKPVLADVRQIVPVHYKRWADRVLMPLPKSAEDFLDTALLGARKGAIVHFYHFCKQGKEPEAAKAVRKAAQQAKRKVKILRVHIVRPYAPRINQVAVDFQLLD